MTLEVGISKEILGARRKWTDEGTRICMRAEMFIQPGTTIEEFGAVWIGTRLVFEPGRALIRWRKGG